MSNVEKKKSGGVSKAGNVFKIILLAVMIFGLFILGKFVLGDATYKQDGRVNTARRVEIVEEAYLDKEYGRVYEDLSRYELTADAFDVYWEIAEAAVALDNLKQWNRAEQKGLDGSTEKKEYYYNEVLSYAQNCKFERNLAELERFAVEAKEIYRSE